MTYQLTPIQQSSITKKREVWDFHYNMELIFISNSSLPMGFLITLKFLCPCRLSSSSLNFSWVAVSVGLPTKKGIIRGNIEHVQQFAPWFKHQDSKKYSWQFNEYALKKTTKILNGLINSGFRVRRMY